MLPIHDENKSATRPYVNYVLLLANISIFSFFLLQDTWPLTTGILELGAIPSSILKGERLWTLLTSMFMHADIMHLAGNMIYLWVFGDNIEDALGHLRYVAFYLLGGLAASFAHIMSLFVALPSLGYTGSDIPAVGASGAISAVLGAYLLLYPKARIRTIVFYFFITIASVPAIYYLGFWFMYQLMMGIFSLTGLPSGVAFWAHIGGFIAGLIGIKAFGPKSKLGRRTGERRTTLRPLVVGSRTVRKPLADVIVEWDKVRIVAQLPGVDKRDIEIEISEREVVILAEHEEMRYHGRIPLATRVAPKVHDLSYRNGVLSFSLPRKM